MSALAPLLGDKQTSGGRVPNDAIDPEQTSWTPIHFGAYVIMAPSVSTGDGGRNVAGEYLVAEPLDYFHFAEDWGLRVGVTARSRKDLLPRCGK
jgi:hypothetical protein